MANDKDVENMKKRIQDAIENANEAFWQEIVKAFPEVKTGDFGPEETFAWDDAMENALYTWLYWNHPDHDLMERAEAEKYRKA